MRPHREEKDVSARAMQALEGHLAIPPDLEERLLDAALGEQEAETSEAVEPPSRSRSRPRGVLWMSVAAALAAGVAYLSWSRLAEPPRTVVTDETPTQRPAVDAPKSWADNLAALELLRKEIMAHDDPEATAKAAPRYVEAIRLAFLDAGKAEIEASLGSTKGEWTAETRATLKAYLLLNDPARLRTEGAWETHELAERCARALAAGPNPPSGDVRATIQPHVTAFLFLVETGLIAGLAIDDRVVDRARRAFASAEPRSYDDAFVAPLASSYPASEVPGVYTAAARRQVHEGLDDAAWVIPEPSSQARIQEALRREEADYDARYIDAWAGLFRGLRRKKIASDDLAKLLDALDTNTRPLGPNDPVTAKFASMVAFRADRKVDALDATGKELLAPLLAK